MKQPKFITEIKQLKTDLSHMTHKQKLEHIWTYYKWIIPVILVVIVLLSIVLASISNRSAVTMMGGVSLNVNLSDEAVAYLQEDYKEHLGLTSERQHVVLGETYIEDLATSSDYADSYYSLMSVVALCVNEQLDYVILNQSGMSMLLPHGVLKDLTDVYTQEELDAMGDLVVYVEDADTGESRPIALDITNTPFIRENAVKSEPVYFTYIINSPRTNEAKDLYQYLLAWKAEE